MLSDFLAAFFRVGWHSSTMLTRWARSFIALGVVACSNTGEDPAASTVRPMDGTDTLGSDAPESAAPNCGDGDTRVCVGSGACEGGQRCDEGEWGACDCGEGGAAGGNAVPPTSAAGSDVGSAGTGSSSSSGLDGAASVPSETTEAVEVPLPVDEYGQIDASSNPLAIQGSWALIETSCLQVEGRSPPVPPGPARRLISLVPNETMEICVSGLWAFCGAEGIGFGFVTSRLLSMQDDHILGFAFDVRWNGASGLGTPFLQSADESITFPLVVSTGESVPVEWRFVDPATEYTNPSRPIEVGGLVFRTPGQDYDIYGLEYGMCISNLRVLVDAAYIAP